MGRTIRATGTHDVPCVSILSFPISWGRSSAVGVAVTPLGLSFGLGFSYSYSVLGTAQTYTLAPRYRR